MSKREYATALNIRYISYKQIRAMQYEQLNNLQTRVLFVVAHPDDEVVGAGGSLLSRFQETHVVHVTDGAPTDMLDAHRNSFASRHDYAQARRQETLAALALAGISEDRVIELGVTDQNSAYQLVSITLKLAELFTQLKPQLVITQPYEGGHPDHDATAFAVHHARRLLDENETAPDVFEMTSYHERDETVVYSEFLPDEGSTPMTVVLTAVQQTLKRSMFDCFQAQRDVLRWFPIELERFRKAPAYDFCHAPHVGSLYYEHFDWGMTGPEWLQLARQAHGVLEQGGIHDARSFERGVSAGAGGAGRNWRSRTDPDLSRRRTRRRRTSLNSHRL